MLAKVLCRNEHLIAAEKTWGFCSSVLNFVLIIYFTSFIAAFEKENSISFCCKSKDDFASSLKSDDCERAARVENSSMHFKLEKCKGN